MAEDPYKPIYNSINWDAPDGPLRCEACEDVGSPRAGSYPSALAHFERTLGPLPRSRSDARILFLLQDPREDEDNFTIANPNDSEFTPREQHRYFCLTQAAWEALGLDESTGNATPIWPNEETAHHYLGRYLGHTRAWPYDGFLAYFLYRFRPQDALVTNLAKCHFGDEQGESVYSNCAAKHLSREAQILEPNLVISFSHKVRDMGLLGEYVPAAAPLPRLDLYHPAAWKGSEERIQRFLEQVDATREALADLGVNPSRLQRAWRQDVARTG